MSEENDVFPGGDASRGPTARQSTGASDRPMPRPSPRAILCPYCGEVSKNVARCTSCGGRFDHLSRQASQNSMGPWQIRDPQDPFRPGCSYETLKKLIAKGKVTESTVLRGPTTRQFWSPAKRTPAVANLFGICHGCQGPVNPTDSECPRCGASFEPETDRQYLGLMPVRLLPGQAPAEMVAASTYQPAVEPSHAPSREPRVGRGAERREAAMVGAAQAPTGVRFEHSMNGAAEVVPGEVLGGEIRLRSDGGGRTWLILAIVVTLLCLATAAGILMLAPALGLELPRWASVLEPAEDEAPVEVAAGEPAEAAEAGEAGREWDGLIRPGIDVGRKRDEAASRREAASNGAAPDAKTDDIEGDGGGPGAETARAEEAVSRVRELIAAGDAESLTLAREMLGEVPQPLRDVLAAAIDRVEALRRISGVL